MKKIFSLSLFVFICFSFSFAQNVGINADASLPNSSAMLDVKSTSKGMLIPRVALTGTADATTISSPATSLMVYNTAAAGLGTTAVVAGYYYWDGAAWVRMVSSTSTGNSTNKTLIPFASGSSFTITTTAPGASRQAGVVGFGNSNTAAINNTGSIDLTSGPNYAFVVPSSGSITEISGFLSITVGSTATPTTVTCLLYLSTGSNNTFTPISGTSVQLGNPLLGPLSGYIGTGSLSGLNIPVAAGARILMVVSANNSFGSNSNITGYFSGGVNMVIQ